jgi:hypothetical protein
MNLMSQITYDPYSVSKVAVATCGEVWGEATIRMSGNCTSPLAPTDVYDWSASPRPTKSETVVEIVVGAFRFLVVRLGEESGGTN